MQWTEANPDPEQVEKLAAELGCSRTLAGLLLNRDPAFVDRDRAEQFLRPRLRHFDDPFRIRGMREVVQRLELAIENQERVLIFGDYDVDGITSTVSLVHFLRQIGMSPDFLVPKRMEEGYGLSRAAVDRALEDMGKPDLFIALDCGTNSHEEVRYLESLGIDVVVVDHHQDKKAGPVDCHLINPHVLHGEESPAPPWLYLCTAGLVFKLIHAMVMEFRKKGKNGAHSLKVVQYLDLCGMGTVGDLVSLLGENRLIAHQGMLRLSQSERPGIRALLECVGIGRGEALEAADVSFKLGPRINAVGRLDDARIPIEMLLEEDYGKCLKTASRLDRLNRERKTIEGRIFDAAREQIEQENLKKAPGIVVSMPEWHHGIVGIVASRLAHEYHRPCLVLGGAAQGNGTGDPRIRKGSGRSISGVDLVRVLGHCRELLDHWGGHPMAVGLSLHEMNLPALRKRFAEVVGRLYSGPPARKLELVAWIGVDDITPGFVEELDLMKPFGQGNPRPVFGVRPVRLSTSPKLLKNEHFRFTLRQSGGDAVQGIAWRMGRSVPPVEREIEMALRVGWNTWRGNRNIQVELVDWRLA